MTGQETLEGGEMGTLACPARDALLDQTTEQKLGHIGLPLVNALGSGCFLGHGHSFLRRGKTEKHGRLEEL